MRQLLKEAYISKGLTPYAAALKCNLETGNMKQYNRCVDQCKDVTTPTKSSMSTPEPNSQQRKTWNARLDAASSVPSFKRLEFHFPD